MMITALTPISEGISQISSIRPAAPGSIDFGHSLLSSVSNLSESQKTSSDLLIAYAAGENVSTHEMVISMEQAKLSLQFAVEVRNRIVEAYQELARMQI